MQLSEAAFLPELVRRYARAIVFYRAPAPRKVDCRFNARGLGIERVLDQLEHDASQGHDGGRRLDLGGNVLGQRQNASPCRPRSACDMAAVVAYHDVGAGVAAVPSSDDPLRLVMFAGRDRGSQRAVDWRMGSANGETVNEIPGTVRDRLGLAQRVAAAPGTGSNQSNQRRARPSSTRRTLSPVALPR